MMSAIEVKESKSSESELSEEEERAADQEWNEQTGRDDDKKDTVHIYLQEVGNETRQVIPDAWRPVQTDGTSKEVNPQIWKPVQ
jgi:hypothetical protein